LTKQAIDTQAQKTFAKARADTLAQIKKYVDIDVEKHAKFAVRDQFGLHEQPQKRKLYADNIVIPALDDMRKIWLQVITDLENGRSVHDIVGQTEIPKYKHITNGDENAGIHSAAEDVKILLLSMGVCDTSKHIFENLRVPDEIKKNIDGGEDRFVGIIEYAAAVQIDTFLSKIENNYVLKTKVPQYLESESEAPVTLKRRMRVSKIFNSIADPSNQFSWLKSSVPTLWPDIAALSEQLSPEMPQNLDFDHRTLPVNTDPNFEEGFYRGLSAAYSFLQNDHYDTFHANEYKDKLALRTFWNEGINSVALDGFDQLRYQISSVLHDEQARGKGATFNDGFAAALNIVEGWVGSLKLSGSAAQDPERGELLSKLKPYWAKRVHAVPREVQSVKESAAQAVAADETLSVRDLVLRQTPQYG